MATRRWRGGAPLIAGVQTWAFGGTWEANDTIKAVVGSKTYLFTAGSTTTATVVANLVTAWNALSDTDYPEFAELTASASTTTFILTHDTTGKSFTVTLTPFESDGSTTADSQTIEGGTSATTGTVSTAVSSPSHWSIAANWIEGVVPTTGDDVIIDEGPSILYGLDQNAVTLATLRITPNFPDTSEIGLPSQTNPSNPSAGYPEYRDQRLKVGATLVEIDTRSRRIRLNLDTDATTVTVNGTGQPSSSSEAALDIVGVNASNVLRVNRGNVWVAGNAADVSTFATVSVAYQSQKESDADVILGRGLTLTTLNQTGGNVALDCTATITTVNKLDGTLTRRASSGTITTFRNRGGVANDDSAGTITNLYNSAEYTFRGLATVTVTNSTVYAFSKTLDPAGRVTWSTAPNFFECHPGGPAGEPGPRPAYFDFGTHRKITIADI